jgi:dCTP deaminase
MPMILTRDAIRREIDAGRVVIDPCSPDQIGPASIDLHLGDEIRVMHPGREPVPVIDEVDYRTFTDVRRLDVPYALAAGETIHGITRERVTLPGDIGGWLEGRSRFARLGLMIHVTSGFVQPGVSSRQVLEMSNVSARTLLIHAGVRLLQIVLQRCEGSAIYQGRFARQEQL